MTLPTVLTLYKPVGATPLDAIREYQQHHPEYTNVPLGYAGRLDPMAEGLLLILVGEENKKRKHYEQLPKIYEFEVLFGIATDSYDILGLITATATPPTSETLKNHIPKIQNKFTGSIRQHYPPYSSKPVKGKPLYWWARAGKLSDVSIPEKTVTIHSLECLSTQSISHQELERTIQERIALVHGKFRQKEILSCWKTYFATRSQTNFPIIRFRATVGSGTYIRTLCQDLGIALGIPAMAVSISRIQIGLFSLPGE